MAVRLEFCPMAALVRLTWSERRSDTRHAALHVTGRFEAVRGKLEPEGAAGN